MKLKKASSKKNGFIVFLLDFLFVALMITLFINEISNNQKLQESLASVVDVFKKALVK
ncbi:MAG: hypothetical protein ACE5J0_03190 [Candidatus Paceibacterales bacterium]